MKKTIITLLAIIYSICIYAQADNKITIGTVDSVQSTILNEKRKVWVYVPSSGSNTNAPTSVQKYPVIYLLDGNAHFASVVGMVQQLSQANNNTVVPEMIVVGILNTDRTRDLTPIKMGDDAFVKLRGWSFKETGGGEAFMSFMEKELIPYIDQHYPTQPYKTLIGQSFGGLAVMNALINHTKLFNSYVAIDPSMWWADMKFLEPVRKTMAEKDLAGTTLYLAMANTMNEGMDIKRVQHDTSLAHRGMRANLALDNFISNKKPKGLRYASKYYENDTHNGVSLIATYDALRFIFDKYELNIEDKDILDPLSPFADKVQQRYQHISKIYGYAVKPPQIEINIWGYRFLQRKQFKKAEEFFKMNVKNYPESFNVYDSYGEFFAAMGDKTKAKEQFKKALAIQENADTRNKLKKLEE